MKKYKYIGDGAGVAGLPHLISDEEARELGVESILVEAVKNGNYVLTDDVVEQKQVTSDKVRIVKEKSNGQ